MRHRLKPVQFRGRTVFKVTGNRRRTVRSFAIEMCTCGMEIPSLHFSPAVRRALIVAWDKHLSRQPARQRARALHTAYSRRH